MKLPYINGTAFQQPRLYETAAHSSVLHASGRVCEARLA